MLIQNHPILSQFFNMDFDWKPFVPENMDNGFYSNPLSIKEKKGQIIIELAVPGYSKGDLTLEITNNLLTISGSKKNTLTDLETIPQKSASSKLLRSIELGKKIDTQSIYAECSNGLLTITLNKKPAHQPQKIDIQ